MSTSRSASDILDELDAKFREVGVDQPSILVALAHLARAGAVYKSMLRAGLVAPDTVVNLFADSMDFILAAPDPNTPPPTVVYQAADGTTIKTTGRKH